MAPVLALAWVLGVLRPAAFAGLAGIVGLGPDLWLGLLLFAAGGVTSPTDPMVSFSPT